MQTTKYILGVVFWVILSQLNAQNVRVEIQTGHTDSVYALAISPDGAYLATAGADGNLLIWDYYERRVLRRISAAEKLAKLAFLDNKTIASLDFSGNLALQHIVTNQSKIFNGVKAFAISANNWVAMAQAEGILLYGKDNLFLKTKPDTLIAIHEVEVLDGSMSGQLIAWCDQHGMLNAYDLSTKQLVLSYKSGRLKQLFWDEKGTGIYLLSNKRLTFSKIGLNGHYVYRLTPDFKRFRFTYGTTGDELLAVACEDGSVYLFNKNNGRLRRKIRLHKDKVMGLAFHPFYNKQLVHVGNDNLVGVFDESSNAETKEFSPSIQSLSKISFHPQNNQFAAALSPKKPDGKSLISLINFTPPFSSRTYAGNTTVTTHLNIGNDSVLFASGIGNRVLRFDLQNNKKYKSKAKISPRYKSDQLFASMVPLSLGNIATVPFWFNNLIPMSVGDILTTAMDYNPKLELIAVAGGRNAMKVSAINHDRNRIVLLNCRTGKTVKRLPGHNRQVNDLKFNTSGTLLASCGDDHYTLGNLIKIWDVASGKALMGFALKDPATHLAWAGDNSIFYTEGTFIFQLDLQTKRKQYIALGSGPIFTSQDKRYVFFQDTESTIGVFDTYTNSLLHRGKLTGSGSKIVNFAPGFHKNQLFSASSNGLIRLWDFEKGEEIASFTVMSNGEFLILTPDQYYFATKDITRFVNFSAQGRYYNFEQFDLKYNRPDIVIKRLGIKMDPFLDQLLQRAYQKRLEKNEVQENMLSAELQTATVNIVSPARFINTTDSIFELKINASDKTSTINRLNIWNNRVPYFGQIGLQLINSNSQLDTSISIVLLPGDNRIQVSITNANGVQSLKETLTIIYQEQHKHKPNLYLIALGASNYQNQDAFLPNISQDIRDLISTVKQKQSAEFQEIIIDTLIDASLTRSRVAAMKSKLQKANPDDIVWVYYGGHGQISANFEYYLASYDNDFANYETNGIPFTLLEQLLDSIPPYQRLLIVNACQSGESDKDIEAFERMRETFPEIRTSNGAWMISSSYGNESALTTLGSQNQSPRNSNFMTVLLKLLRVEKKPALTGNFDAIANINSRNLKVSELGNFLESEFNRLSETGEISEQHPHIRTRNIDLDFAIWKYR